MGLLKMGIVSTICALIVIARAMIEAKWEELVFKATETSGVDSDAVRWKRRYTIAPTDSYEERLIASMCGR